MFTATVIIATLFILAGLSLAASGISLSLYEQGDLLGAAAAALGVVAPAMLVYSTSFNTTACVVAVFVSAFVVNEMSAVRAMSSSNGASSTLSMSPDDDA